VMYLVGLHKPMSNALGVLHKSASKYHGVMMNHALHQPFTSAETAGTQPYVGCLTRHGINSDGNAAGGCKSSRFYRCF